MPSPRTKADPIWVFFALFLLLNGLLAYGPISLTLKLWFALLGILALVAFLRWPLPPTNLKPDPLTPVSVRIPLFFCLLGVGARFISLRTLSVWPDPDESLFATDAIHIGQHWDWHFFYAYSQACFPFPWLLALWFKVIPPSLTSLWLFTAILSAAIVPLLYFSMCPFFSRGFTWLLTALGALAYWGLYAGRIGNTTLLEPLVEIPVLGLLGRVLIAPPSHGFSGKAALLGLGLALGFYVYPPAWFPLAALALGLILIQKRKDLSVLTSTGATFLLGVLPFLISALREHYGTYIGGIHWTAHSLFDPQQFLVSSSYITGLFWGKTSGDYYGPFWGGLFDPLTASLVLLGIRSGWMEAPNHARKWIWLALGASMAPGVFSGNLEFFRVFFIFPFVIFLAAMGFTRLKAGLKPQGRTFSLALTLTLVAGLNFYHLFGPFHDHWKDPGPSWSFYKSPENFRAWQFLKKVQKDKGPGFLFLNFPSDMSDRSLTLAAYGTNLTLHPPVNVQGATWFAVLTNENYRAFLLQRFPGGTWVPLSSDLDRPDGGLGLGIFPLASMPQADLQRWIAADRALDETAYVFLNRPTGTDYSNVLGTLENSKKLFQGDRFLAASFWEREYYLHLQNGLFGDKRKKENYGSALGALRAALTEGYPAAHLWNELGSMLWVGGDRPGAEKAFQNAVRTGPDFEPARANLQNLQTLKDQVPKP